MRVRAASYSKNDSAQLKLCLSKRRFRVIPSHQLSCLYQKCAVLAVAVTLNQKRKQAVEQQIAGYRVNNNKSAYFDQPSPNKTNSSTLSNIGK